MIPSIPASRILTGAEAAEIQRSLDQIVGDRAADGIEGQREAAAIAVKGALHVGPDALGCEEAHEQHNPDQHVAGALKLQGRAASFETPEGVDISAAFSISTDLRTAQIFLRDGRGLNLRNRSRQIADATTPVGWQKFEIGYRDHQRFVEELLWYSDDLIVSAPQELRVEIIGHLKSGMVRYG